MVISSGGGFILDFALSDNPGVAVFSPVINGVGGNLVAVFSSRISTYLHLNHEKTQLPTEFGTGCVQPCFLLCSPGKVHSVCQVYLVFRKSSKESSYSNDGNDSTRSSRISVLYLYDAGRPSVNDSTIYNPLHDLQHASRSGAILEAFELHTFYTIVYRS